MNIGILKDVILRITERYQATGMPRSAAVIQACRDVSNANSAMQSPGKQFCLRHIIGGICREISF